MCILWFWCFFWVKKSPPFIVFVKVAILGSKYPSISWFSTIFSHEKIDFSKIKKFYALKTSVSGAPNHAKMKNKKKWILATPKMAFFTIKFRPSTIIISNWTQCHEAYALNSNVYFLERSMVLEPEKSRSSDGKNTKCLFDT